MKTGILTLVVLCFAVSLSQAQSLPQGIGKAIEQVNPVSLLPENGLDNAWLGTTSDTHGSMTRTNAGALELVCLESTMPVHDLQLVVPVKEAIAKGDTLLVLLNVQSLSHDPAHDFGLLFLNFERDKKWTKSLGCTAKLTDQPQWLAIPFAAREDLNPDEGRLTLPFGFFPQSLRISEIRLLNFGKQVAVDELSTQQYHYDGYQPDAPWRRVAEQRIEQIRKAPLAVSVVDAQGQPVADAKVHVQMQRHAFGFGTAVNEWKMIKQDQDSRIYQQKLAELFNRATLETGLKWQSWLRQGNEQRVQRTMQWLADHNIDIRGHTMVWPSWNKSPTALVDELKADPQVLREKVLAYIHEVGTYCKGKVVEWDVANEIHNNHDYMDMLGEQAIDTWFQAAHEVDSNVPLFINEFGIVQGNGGYALAKQDRHLQIVKQMLDRGTSVDGMGFQCHFRLYDVTPPQQVWAILDRYAELGLKLGITEYDLAWVSEDFQAQYLRDFMTACFAHPAINQFVMWGFWDGSHWREDGGMFARDWREKPSLAAYRDLVFKRWWTDQTLDADEQGSIQTRGFLGDYRITATLGGRATSNVVQLPAQGLQLKLTLN